MPKLPGSVGYNEDRLRKALAAVLRKVGWLRSEVPAPDFTLLELARDFCSRAPDYDGLTRTPPGLGETTPGESYDADIPF